MGTQQNEGTTPDEMNQGNDSPVEKKSLLPTEPPVNLPIISDEEDDLPMKSDSLEKPKEEKGIPLSKLTPKTVPGMRGPLPTHPDPMKVSSAKFGAISPLNKLSNGNVAKGGSDKGEEEDTTQQMVKKDEAKIPSGKPLIETASKPKISVPLPPVSPSVSPKVVQDKVTGKTDAKITPQQVPAPQPTVVDRNIRPRRLAILVIALISFVAVVIFAIWFLLLRNTQTQKPVESPLFSDGSPVASPVVSESPVADFSQKDTDSDGITDAEEQQLGTDINKADTDGDGYTDKQELDAGYDPLVTGGKLDTDRDGLSDPAEKCWNTDSNNPDTDGDGYLDGQEVTNHYDPLVSSPNDKLQGQIKCQGL